MVHTLQETEDWFDKVTVSRNMKELTNHLKQFSKINENFISSTRLSGLYEDMGNILNRYYEIPETHVRTMTMIEMFVIKKNMVDTILKKAIMKAFFKSDEKFGISSPDQLKDDEAKKFFNYVGLKLQN